MVCIRIQVGKVIYWVYKKYKYISCGSVTSGRSIIFHLLSTVHPFIEGKQDHEKNLWIFLTVVAKQY